MADVKINIIAEDNFTGVLGNFGSIMTGIESVVNLAKRAFDAIVVPVVEFGAEAVLAAARVDELIIVNNVLAENAGIPALALQQEAEEVRKMGIEAGVAQSVVAEFIKANLDFALASDIARIAQDAAVISGLNSTEVTERIIHGITTLNPLVLRNAGIIVDTAAAYDIWAEANNTTATEMSTTEKQAALLNAVMEAGESIAGSYAAAMESPGKVLRSFPRYFDDIMIAIGTPFQDAFFNVVFAFADLAKWTAQAASEGGVLYPILVQLGEAAETATALLGPAFEIMKKVFNGEDFKLYDFGSVLQGMKDISPVFFEIGTALRVYQQAIDDGQGARSALAAGLNRLVDLNPDLKIFADTISGFTDAFKNGLSAQAVNDALDVIDSQLAVAVSNYDWTELGASFGEAILGAMGSGIETKQTELAPALGLALANFFKGAIGESWSMASGQDTAAVFLRVWIIEPFQNFISFGPYQELFKRLGGDIMDGIKAGFTGKWEEWRTAFTDFWNTFIAVSKAILGISSPSTVFAGIGVNIIQGMINGMSSMFGVLLSFVNNMVDSLLAPFAPLIDIIGGSTGGASGGVSFGGGGTTGGRTGGGTLTSTAVENYYNYYYGPVYFSGNGQTNGGVDCQSPNPALSALGSHAPRMGVT